MKMSVSYEVDILLMAHEIKSPTASGSFFLMSLEVWPPRILRLIHNHKSPLNFPRQKMIWGLERLQYGWASIIITRVNHCWTLIYSLLNSDSVHERAAVNSVINYPSSRVLRPNFETNQYNDRLPLCISSVNSPSAFVIVTNGSSLRGPYKTIPC